MGVAREEGPALQCAVVLFILGCVGVPAPGDSSADAPPDSGTSVVTPTCVEAASASLPAPSSSTLGTSYREVRVVTAEGTEALLFVSWSPAGITAWSSGAPVVVSAAPAHKPETIAPVGPTFYFGPDVGVVEVQPAWPGWTVDGETLGTFDAGGPDARAVLDAALAFATGGPDRDGQTLASLVPFPVCIDAIAVAAMSSGGMPAVAGLAEYGAAYAKAIVGFSLYEPPSLPEFVVAEAGAIWMDPDPQADADGNGVAWDDGRNLSLDDASCSIDGCAVDYSSLAWTDSLSLDDVWTGYGPASPSGVFWFDRDHDGVLSFDDTHHTDTDGDGVIGALEDTYERPLVVGEGALAREYYTPGLARAAAEQGDAWPDIVATPAETEAFWAEHSMAAWAAQAAETLPDTSFALVFTSMPHGPALASRPGERVLHDAWVEAGVVSTYNFSMEAAKCYGGEGYDDYPGPPPDNTMIPASELPDWAVPEAIGTANIQPVAALDQLQRRFGRFDHCPRALLPIE